MLWRIKRVNYQGSRIPKSGTENFWWICLSAAYTAAVNPIDIKTLLANISKTFFISNKPVFNNNLRDLPGNPPGCVILA